VTIRRYEVSSGEKKGRAAPVRSLPGGTGAALVRVDIEASLATDRNALVSALEQITKKIAGERWPMR